MDSWSAIWLGMNPVVIPNQHEAVGRAIRREVIEQAHLLPTMISLPEGLDRPDDKTSALCIHLTDMFTPEQFPHPKNQIIP